MQRVNTVDKAAVDKAFDALKTFDWGTDRNALNPIDNAAALTYGDAAGRKDLETRLLAALPSGNRDVKDFICRTLKTMGTVASVPALAALLPDKDNSHMARYALERIPGGGSGRGPPRGPGESDRRAEDRRDRLARRPPRRRQRRGPRGTVGRRGQGDRLRGGLRPGRHRHGGSRHRAVEVAKTAPRASRPA